MDIFSLLVLWLHVIAAVIWVGGNLILAMVIVPHFRQHLPPVQRIQLLTQIGRRFEPIVWGCIGVLFFTGIINIFFSVDLTTSTPLANAFVRTLLIKIGLFFLLVILTVLHGMFFGPRLAAAIQTLDPNIEELPPEVNKLRSQMSIVSSLMGVVSLLILLAAVALRMGI
jgi:uncharacterized membrane protein